MKQGMYLHFMALVFSSCVFFSSYAQSRLLNFAEPSGLPNTRYYSPEEYKAFNQNWGAVQDSLGILYFANGSGVLSYDGVWWDLIELPNQSHAKSIAIDKNQRIYVGASNELGYLQPNKHGRLDYVSLMPFLKEQDVEIGTVWKIFAAEEGIYFDTNGGFLFWNGKEFKLWKFKSGEILESFLFNGEVHVHLKDKGLTVIQNGKFINKISSETLDGHIFKAILPFDDSRILFATYNDGLYLWEGKTLTKFKTSIDQFFSTNKLYRGIKLNNNAFAFGTLTDGLVVIDQGGQQIFRYDNSLAESAMMVLNLFQDKSGILWLTLNDGLLKIEYPSPFSYFNKKSGINSRVQKIVKFNDSILVGTANGLYQLRRSVVNQNYTFDPYKGFKAKIWDLLVFDNILLVADEDAVYEVKEDIPPIKIANYNSSAFLRSKLDKNRVYIALSNGLRSIYFESGTWKDEGKIEDIHGGIYTLVETSSGDLWLETSEDWLWRISYPTIIEAKQRNNPKARKYLKEDGLPGTRGDLFLFEGQIYFTSSTKITYHFDQETDSFKRATELANRLGHQNKDIAINHVGEIGNIWFATHTEGADVRYLGIKDKSEYQLKDLKETRIADRTGGSHALYYEKTSQTLWLSGKNEIIRHDLSIETQEEKLFPALITSIVYKKDSVLLEGAYSTTLTSVPFKNNSFRFQYASPSYHAEDTNQFRYLLEGFDQGWSSWTHEKQAHYTNIPEGEYTFKIQAKNIFEYASKVSEVQLRILAPWYRTWWAYLLYILGGLFLIWAISQWRSQQLRNKNLVLEAVVHERTEEILKKNKKLSYQTERLKELDIMKTRLFANISHEFRTPLTLIKGPVEKLEAEQKTQISMPNIKMIRRNANRLLNLVNQLLDLSKLDSGKLKLNPAEGDVFKCIRAAASAYSSHAASRNMDYQITIPSRLLWASFDRDKLEKVVHNLLGNAFKFTDDEGRIGIVVTFRSGRLRLKVSDSGSGIAADKLPHIFDRFYQVDDSYTKEKTGSGIGLALTKELVELMGGTIFVESELQQGTLFKVVISLDEIKSSHKEIEEEKPLPIVLDDTEQTPLIVSTKREIKVLVIEDNNDMRFFIKEQLVANYEVLEAQNGEVGLQEAIRLVPDLIITDLMMPQMDGITLCRKLKTHKITSHIPVIMLTAKAGIENRLEGLETGADDYLTKPFNARELDVRTNNLIVQRRRLQERYSKNVSLDPKKIAVSSVDEEFLEEILAVMEEKYTDPAFGPSALQKTMSMSKTQLHRKLKALTNHPPSELLRNFRLKRAAQVLPQRKDNISQVAYDVGFNSLSYFTKCFKDLYGVSPTKYLDDQNTSMK